MAMSEGRRAVPESLLLLWYVAIAPLAGAVAAIVLVNALIPVSTASWLRGVWVVLAGMSGVLAGGALGSYAPRSVAVPSRRSWRAVPTFMITTAAAVAMLIGTGTPLPWMHTISAGLVVTVTIMWTVRRHTR